MVEGLPSVLRVDFCTACIHGKKTRRSFPTGQAYRARDRLELVHMDLCGPMSMDSLGGSRYFMLLIDDFTRYNWVYFLTHKSEALECFKGFKTLVERQSGKKLKRVRSDLVANSTLRSLMGFS